MKFLSAVQCALMQKVIFREKIASILYLISGFLTIVTVTSLAKLSFSAFMCLETVGVETYGHKGESVGLVTITFRLVRYYCSALCSAVLQ